MPPYRNRPRLDPETPLWRYLDLEAVVATLRDCKLRFTRVDTFSDPFEGSVPRQEIDNQLLLFSGAQQARMALAQVATHFEGMAMPADLRWREDDWVRMTRLRRAKTRAAHASCWAAGPESEALWRLYCQDEGTRGLGVALRTTLGRLEASLAEHDLYVSPVRYRPYHVGAPFTDELDSFMHKRQGFDAEREVRLLSWNNAQYLGLINVPPTVQELDRYLFLSWQAAEVLEEIVLSPYAEEPYEQRAREAIAKADSALADRVILSELNPRRYAPGF